MGFANVRAGTRALINAGAGAGFLCAAPILTGAKMNRITNAVLGNRDTHKSGLYEFQVTRLAKPTDETYGKQMVAACKARTSPLPSKSDSSQFPSTCSSLPLVSGCSNVAC